ncbi:hypothetical protein AB4Z46_33945, partial [Variovorax sp. M-6]|uniref:hypothetical protein n=1 Tax=Variovorax sp. M-6 TaxID=3233041 RepID=UPI003F9B2254
MMLPIAKVVNAQARIARWNFLRTNIQTLSYKRRRPELIKSPLVAIFRAGKVFGFFPPTPGAREHKGFKMNSQIHAVSGWPERPEEPVAYLQVSDYVRMLLRRTDVVGPTCPSCHTVNRGRLLHCRACGASMPSRIDEKIEDPPAPDASDKASFPEANALRSVLRLTLGPSLVLFVAFASWYAFRTESRTRYESSASTMSIRAASVVPRAAPSSKGIPLRVAVVDAGAIS